MAGKYIACLCAALLITLTVQCRDAHSQQTTVYDVDPTTGYRMERYRAPVPDDLPGARTLDTRSAKSLHDQHSAVFIDVYPPKGLGPDPLDGQWLTNEVRYSLPGAVWLPETGRGHLEADALRYLSDNLDRLTAGDQDKALVFFCTSDCWQSWNAARRALELGYTRVLWYPLGTDGWLEDGHDLLPVEPVNFLGASTAETIVSVKVPVEDSMQVYPDTAQVFLIDQNRNEQAIGTVRFSSPGSTATGVEFTPEEEHFEDQFLSMRPFQCLTDVTEWFCHLPYPYDLPKTITANRLTDLEYQLLFIWKSPGSFGIDPWNGVYYQLELQTDGSFAGRLLQGDLNVLANPPETGSYPIDLNEFTAEDADKRRFPALVIRP